jgi:hypothetical protein
VYINISGLSAAALSIYDEEPGAVDWFAHAIDAFGKTEEWLAHDGASNEGYAYWQYSMEWLIKYAKMVEKFTGHDMLQNVWFKNSSKYAPIPCWERTTGSTAVIS